MLNVITKQFQRLLFLLVIAGFHCEPVIVFASVMSTNKSPKKKLPKSLTPPKEIDDEDFQRILKELLRPPKGSNRNNSLPLMPKDLSSLKKLMLFLEGLEGIDDPNFLMPLNFNPAQHFGVSGVPVDATLRSQLHLKNGCVIIRLLPGSTAALMGIKKHDIVTDICGRTIKHPRDVGIGFRKGQQQIAKQSFTIQLVRGGKATTIRCNKTHPAIKAWKKSPGSKTGKNNPQKSIQEQIRQLQEELKKFKKSNK